MSKLKSMGLSFLKKMLDLLKDATSDLHEIRKIKVGGKKVQIENTDIDILGPTLEHPHGRLRLELAYLVGEELVTVEAERNLILEPEEVEVRINGADVDEADIDVRPNIGYDLGSLVDGGVSAGLVFVIETDDGDIVAITKAVKIGLSSIL